MLGIIALTPVQITCLLCVRACQAESSVTADFFFFPTITSSSAWSERWTSPDFKGLLLHGGASKCLFFCLCFLTPPEIKACSWKAISPMRIGWAWLYSIPISRVAWLLHHKEFQRDNFAVRSASWQRVLLKRRVLTALKVIRVCVCVRVCEAEIVSVIAPLAMMSFTLSQTYTLSHTLYTGTLQGDMVSSERTNRNFRDEQTHPQ